MSTILNSKQGGFVTHFDVTNFSVSKQKFSFSKGQRFPSVKKTLNDALQYGEARTFGKRAPSFGIGDRFENMKRACKNILNAL